MPVRPSWMLIAALSAMPSCSGCPGFGPAPPEMQRENLETAVFASETTVTWRDGTTPIGVFFDSEHRRAVTWDELPTPWIVAIVASEDGRFWSHVGVDPQHIARAARDDLEAGEVVSGGSTITQQTAKNLFDRPDRSMGSKMEELDYALRLEKLYTKREILTFYANQFYVTGNGLGIGIAARYYFDKAPKDLTLVESAFIAGSVKGPANYDPFLGDAEHQAAAKVRAVDRTRYVLQRILDESDKNLIPKPGDGKQVTQADIDALRAEAKQLLDSGFEIPFRLGQFRFDTSAVLDEVNRRLKAPTFAKIMAENGIDDPDTAGLTIVTTLDQKTQHEATYGLWHQLGDLGVMLEARDAASFVQAEASPPRPDPSHPPARHDFRTAQIKAHTGDHLDADVGGFACTLDRDAMVRAAASVYRGKVGDRYAKVPTAEVDKFVAAIPDKAVVFVSVRDVPKSGPPLCDLENRPELQGAAVVLEDGEVRAMVGGNTNKDFNRATALRQFGSTFKPLIYHAALTLGWQPDDAIDNRRNVFPFEGTFYAPSPDHDPHPWVSLAWAGVNSENLASVWLLYHLLDNVGDREVAHLADELGLAQKAGEADEAYRARIQKLGILPTAGRLPEGQFLEARTEIVRQLQGEGKDDEARELRSMLYGWGFDKRSGGSSEERRALDDSWTHLKPMMQKCRDEYESLDRALARGGSAAAPDLSVREGPDGVEVACGSRPEGFESPSDVLRVGVLATPPAAPPPARVQPPGSGRGGKAKGKAKNQRPDPEPEPAEPDPEPGGGRGLFGRSGRLQDLDRMLVDGRVTYGTLDSVASAMERHRLVAENGGVNLYAPDQLYWHQDFRTLLAITYVTHLAAKYGVHTKLAEVMSLPLGASEITLEEAARMYEGLTSGEVWAFSDPNAAPNPDDPGPTTLIFQILDRDGKVLYEAHPQPRPVSSGAVGEMTSDILRNVVRYGTGRSAKDSVKAGAAFVPLGGKTGTTNDFKNVAFVGYLPEAGSDGYSAAGGPIIAVYVGYDDNHPMKSGKISVSGAVGALPAWISLAQAMHDSGESTAGLDARDGYWPLAHGSGLVAKAVGSDVGLPSDEASGATVLTRIDRGAPEAPPVPRSHPEPHRASKSRPGKKWWQWPW